MSSMGPSVQKYLWWKRWGLIEWRQYKLPVKIFINYFQWELQRIIERHKYPLLTQNLIWLFLSDISPLYNSLSSSHSSSTLAFLSSSNVTSPRYSATSSSSTEPCFSSSLPTSTSKPTWRRAAGAARSRRRRRTSMPTLLSRRTRNQQLATYSRHVKSISSGPSFQWRN